MIHLESVSAKGATAEAVSFPCSVPAVQTLGTIEVTAPVSCFVGEKGSRNSTLLADFAQRLADLAVEHEGRSAHASGLAEGRVRGVAFDDVDHVTVTRAFLNDPARYVRHLVSTA